MNIFIWNGKMDCGWEDLSKLLVDACREFTSTMLKTVEFSPNEESRELLHSECMERFESITDLLADTIKDGSYYAYEDLDNKIQNALKLNGWILLGSLTETVLQMFLSFYISDYKKEKWQQWEQFKIDQVQMPIFDCIQDLVNNGNLETQQAKSLKRAIRDTIRDHTNEHPVHKVMLDELIQLYKHLELLDDDEITWLKEIQSNRNGIHSFQDRKMGTWSDLQFSVRFFCYLLKWVIEHLPDVPDENYWEL